MTLAEICVLIGDFAKSDYVSTGIIVLLASSVVLEFSQKKFKPWTWMIKKFGKLANEEVSKRLTQIEEDIEKLYKKNEMQDELNKERDAVAARREILKFGDSLRHGVLFSRESYEQVLIDMDNYDRYCASHPEFKNNRTLSAHKRILSDFETRDKSNDFLD